MRARKVLKIGSITVVSLLVLGFLALVTFVWNPLEGSYPDLRDAVPRTVDFYVRKQHLAADFTEFPEPHFVGHLRTEHPRVVKSAAWRSLAQELRRPVEDLTRLRADLQQGQVDLVEDVIGADTIIAGRMTGRPEGAQWCLYTRVSWKVCLGYGLLQYDSFRARLAGITVAPIENGYTITARGAPAPVHIARVQDCLMVSNHKELLDHSFRLATRELQEDTVGRTADYKDEMETPISRWAEKAGRQPDPIEVSLDAQSYLRGASWDDTWPNPQSPDSQLERVLALLLNPKSFRKLMGPVLLEPDGVTAILKGFLNRQDQSAFQRRLFTEAAPPGGEWFVPFLRTCVPATTCAGVFLRVPVDSLLEELFATIDRPYREEINNALAGTQNFNNVQKLIAELAPSFQPQVGLLLRINKFEHSYGELDCYIEPSPIPAFALAFWTRPGESKRIHEALSWFHLNHRKFGFEKAYTLDSGPGGLEKVREWCHKHIEGTGEIAAVFMDHNALGNSHLFLISNSGPYIKEIVDFRSGKGGHKSIVLESSFLAEAMREVPSATNAFAFVQGPKLREVLERYRDFSATRFTAQVRDPAWEAEERPSAKLAVLRRDFRGKSENGLSAEEKRRFDEAVDDEMGKRWQTVLPKYSAERQGGVEDAINLFWPLHAFYAHFRFDPQWIALQARVALSGMR